MVRAASALLALYALFLPALAAQPPNIVMIVADDQAWGDYGFMGHPSIRTPHLDRLARESLVFVRGYVPSSLCRASLASMITGLYPHQHGVTSNDPPLPPGLSLGQAMKEPDFLSQRNRMAEKIARSPTLPKLLAARGYVSLQTGKWWESNSCRCGFSEGMTHGDPARGGRHGDEGLKIGRESLNIATRFIDRTVEADKPFFLWYAPMMPHQPHNPPERLLSQYRTRTDSAHVARYWAMCEWFDETVGELLGHLDRKRLAKNTLVVFLSDNGWIQDPRADGYASRSKRSPYDGGIRTPILLRWPNRIRPQQNGELAISIDLAPTLLKAAGHDGIPRLPGINLLDHNALGRRKAIYGAIFTHNAVDIDQPAANLQYRWVIAGKLKLIVPGPEAPPDAAAELYDIQKDPQEQTNLAKPESADVSRLTKLLNSWWPGTPVERAASLQGKVRPHKPSSSDGSHGRPVIQ